MKVQKRNILDDVHLMSETTNPMCLSVITVTATLQSGIDAPRKISF